MSISIEAAESSPPENLLAHYAPRNGAYDELLDANGRIREPWKQFSAGLETMGMAGVSQRHELARRLLRENGLLQGIAGFPHGTDRFWELDPLPLLLAKSEWDSLAAAISQRVEVLNLVLADLYGPQSLVRDGLLPPQLVFGQRSAFLLPCHGVNAPRNIHLHMYAGHLVRGADGQWSVFADYTQGLSGAGLALENRIVTSRILPADFHNLHVERLAGFFVTLRDTLQSLSPLHSDNPRVVILSPGPRSPGYFEDAYLARYLGYTLVEGGDLTVRGTNVCLKTLGGLLPVDVVIRRTPDEESDPLELRADSLYGVTGLVEAARSGQVVVANSLGSGLLESPALMAFLPAICRKRLGEELKLRSAATWWCGNDEDWSHVEAHFDEMMIRPTMPSRGQFPVDVAALEPRQARASAQAKPFVSIARPTFPQLRVDRSTGARYSSITGSKPGRSDCAYLPWRIATALIKSCPADWPGRCRLRTRMRRSAGPGPVKTNFPSARAARTFGSFPIGRYPRSRCSARRLPRSSCAVAAMTCPAASRITSTGLAATLSARMGWCGIFAPSCSA